MIKAKIKNDVLKAKVAQTFLEAVELPTPTITLGDHLVTASVTLANDSVVRSGTKTKTREVRKLYIGDDYPTEGEKFDLWLAPNGTYQGLHRCTAFDPAGRPRWTGYTVSLLSQSILYTICHEYET